MKLFESKFANRIAISKTVGIIFGWIWFFVIPKIFSNADLFLRFWVWFWYISLWWVIWLMWIMKKHPVLNLHMPFWFRWAFIWAWMNFVITLFIHDKLVFLMTWTFFDWYSPFWLVVEWIIFWVLTDFLATKYAWEWKTLIK